MAPGLRADWVQLDAAGLVRLDRRKRRCMEAARGALLGSSAGIAAILAGAPAAAMPRRLMPAGPPMPPPGDMSAPAQRERPFADLLRPRLARFHEGDVPAHPVTHNDTYLTRERSGAR